MKTVKTFIKRGRGGKSTVTCQISRPKCMEKNFDENQEIVPTTPSEKISLGKYYMHDFYW